MSTGATAPAAAAAPAKEAREQFPRGKRLLRPKDFRRVFEQPLKSGDRFFTLLARRGTNRQRDPRLGLAISRKCAPRAVDRNRIKRLIRESFRRDSGLTEAVDVVVMCRPPARDTDKATLRQSLDRHWLNLRQRLCASSSG